MRRMVSAAVLCLTTTSILAAQRTESPLPAPPHESGHETLLLTGCLSAGKDPSTFKLTKASIVPPPATSAAPAPLPAPVVGTSGVVVTPERTEYLLKVERRLDTPGVSELDLKTLVGRQVEVTARPPEAPAAEPPRADGQGKPQPPPGEAVEPRAEPLTAIAIKSLQATCR